MSRIFASINEPIPGYVAAAEADPERIPPEYTRDPPTCPETSSIRSESRMAFDGSVNTTKGFLNLVNSARKSLQPARADQPILIPKTMAVESYDRAWRRGDIPLPDFLRPSLAYASLCCGIVSSPDNPGEEPVMEWEKIMRIAGLGRVECLVYSSYVRLSHLMYLGVAPQSRLITGLTTVCVWIGCRLPTSIHRA